MSGTSDAPLEEVVLDDVRPERIDPADVRAALESPRPLVRQRGARVCASLAETDVERVRPFVDDLGQRLHDENPGVVQATAGTLTEVASADPDAVAGVVTHAAALADADLAGVQLAGAELLAAVATQRPTHCVPVVGTLLDSLDRPMTTADGESVADCIEDRATQRTVRQHEQEERQHEQVARQLLANVVVAVADADPDAVADHVEAVAPLTDHEDLVVRGAALDTLALVAQTTPTAVDPVADDVVACLDAESTVVRARAVKTLGYLGDEQYVEPLRQVAAADPDQDVAALADETATFLQE